MCWASHSAEGSGDVEALQCAACTGSAGACVFLVFFFPYRYLKTGKQTHFRQKGISGMCKFLQIALLAV